MISKITGKRGNIRLQRFILCFIVISEIPFSCSETKERQEENQDPLLNFVDPFIGTATVGHTYPAATTPFGMVQIGPDTGTKGWEHCSGYHYDDQSIIGFSLTHLSGTGAAGMDYYVIGSPSVKSATLFLPNGEKFEIKATSASDKNIYIRSATLQQ